MLFWLLALLPRPAVAGDAPAWMHALTNASLPPHDEKTDAVLLYSEEILMVQPNGKLKEIDRNAYKILASPASVAGAFPRWEKISR